MSLSMILSFVWFVAANIAAVLPSNDHHWRRAYVLIATGIPLLIFVIFQNGLLIGLIVLAAAVSVLRWPVRYLMRWAKRTVGRGSNAQSQNESEA